jgi:hypothetical protein
VVAAEGAPADAERVAVASAARSGWLDEAPAIQSDAL